MPDEVRTNGGERALNADPERLQTIEFATVLASDARSSADSQRPIIIFVTQKGCQFCQLLRERVLYPMIRGGQLTAKAILREVSLDAGFSLTDFAGETVAGSAFARRYGAEVTPTLLFLDGKGRQLADRIVGISNIEYYGFYLDKAIASATKAMAETETTKQ